MKCAISSTSKLQVNMPRSHRIYRTRTKNRLDPPGKLRLNPKMNQRGGKSTPRTNVRHLQLCHRLGTAQPPRERCPTENHSRHFHLSRQLLISPFHSWGKLASLSRKRAQYQPVWPNHQRPQSSKKKKTLEKCRYRPTKTQKGKVWTLQPSSVADQINQSQQLQPMTRALLSDSLQHVRNPSKMTKTMRQNHRIRHKYPFGPDCTNSVRPKGSETRERRESSQSHADQQGDIKDLIIRSFKRHPIEKAPTRTHARSSSKGNSCLT